MKQRLGLGKQSAKRIAYKAYVSGTTQQSANGLLKRWMEHQYLRGDGNANQIRAYGDKAYLFHDCTLVTVIKIPRSVLRGKREWFTGEDTSYETVV